MPASTRGSSVERGCGATPGYFRFAGGSPGPRLACAVLVGCVLAGCPSPMTRAVPVPAAHLEPEVLGVTHVVQPGETLWRISRDYSVPVEELVRVNALGDPSKLAAGQALFIPGGRRGDGAAEVPESPARADPPAKPPPDSATAAKAATAATTSTAGKLAWPLDGVLYARYGRRGELRHDGLDIAAPEGSVVRAAEAGTVLFSAQQRGYGHLVIIEHPSGLLTLYAHNRRTLVAEGAKVKRGDPIAEVGFSNRTSGPHLHFEVREEAIARDPLLYLPPPR